MCEDEDIPEPETFDDVVVELTDELHRLQDEVGDERYVKDI